MFKTNKMYMKSGYITLVGFILLLLGFLSVLFSLVGLQFTFFKFMTNLGPGLSLLIQLIMIIGGIVLMYISRASTEDYT